MIVVDTSALVSILKSEPDAAQFAVTLAEASRVVIAAPTKFELLLVMARSQHEDGVEDARLLLAANAIETADWTDDLADIATSAFLRYGKGHHKAGLNFGDCMAYALAKSLDAPLLFKGEDFASTDITPALQS